MNNTFIAKDGLLILPRLQIQNANAIGSPLTHGFPSITAFIGFMWALNRRFIAQEIGLNLNGVGVVCHLHAEQISRVYERKEMPPIRKFCLSRHPNKKSGGAASIIEEGRMHLEASLIFDVNRVGGTSEESLFLQGEEERRGILEAKISQIIFDMRVAGGSIISENPTAQLLGIPENHELRAKEFNQLSRQLLPGFALVSRHHLLNEHWQKMKCDQPSASLLDAWLDLSRFNYRVKSSNGDDDGVSAEREVVEWRHDRPEGSGWIVPIPVGYSALSPLYPAGSVRSSRDAVTPFRFVEALHSIGEWVAPHRLTDVDQLLWYPETDLDKGLYRVINRYICPNDK